MTMDAFEELVDSFDNTGWYGAWQEAYHLVVHAAAGKGFNPAGIGWVAWAELDDDQRRDALNSLFVIYFNRICEEDSYRRLEDAAASGKSYLNGWEQGSLHDAVMEADLTDEDAEVTVNAEALYRVLAELDLLQHRLAMKGQ